MRSLGLRQVRRPVPAPQWKILRNCLFIENLAHVHFKCLNYLAHFKGHSWWSLLIFTGKVIFRNGVEYLMKPDNVVSCSTKIFFFFSFFFPFRPNHKRSTPGWLTVGKFASFPGRFVRHSEDTGCLLHDPHEEVVDVVLEFPDVGVFPPKELFVLH